jgi:nitrogen PTS system EIIA component
MKLTVRDVGKLLSVSEKFVLQWIEEDELPAYRVNGQYRFNRADLMEWASSRKMKLSSDLFSQETGSAQASLMADALGAGGILYGIVGENRDAVMASVVQGLKLPPDVDRNSLLNVLLARENLASTGVGDGIALPHVRNPIVVPVSHPQATLCFLAHPVDFGALDGKPVQILFVLVSPTIRLHLRLLSRLAFALRDAEFKAMLDQRAPAETIFAAARRIEEHFREV